MNETVVYVVGFIRQSVFMLQRVPGLSGQSVYLTTYLQWFKIQLLNMSGCLSAPSYELFLLVWNIEKERQLVQLK